MGGISSPIPNESAHSHAATPDHNSKLKSIKEVAESPNLLSNIPSNYAYFPEGAASAVDNNDSESHLLDHDSIPVIDFSLLQSASLDQRSKVIGDLGDACQRWGFFMVVNHGVPKILMDSMLDKCNEFFNLTSEEKRKFEGKHVLDPIRCGTSFNTAVEEVNFWRDYLKVMVHPQFHSPSKPPRFSEVSLEYCKQIRHVARVLLKGLSASLGLDELEIERSMDLEMGQQILIANYYPPCPRPDLAIGMPPHSDHGLLTFLAQNQVDGLQIMHDGKWVPVHALPNSFLVNTGDHIEVNYIYVHG
uniref:Fe2OG dioxygenase domain-containing protein n=1 Tax=Opuntia streptacantha TaxID=393608 RepID=A0A7C9CQA7_OPUST